MEIEIGLSPVTLRLIVDPNGVPRLGAEPPSTTEMALVAEAQRKRWAASKATSVGAASEVVSKPERNLSNARPRAANRDNTTATRFLVGSRFDYGLAHRRAG